MVDLGLLPGGCRFRTVARDVTLNNPRWVGNDAPAPSEATPKHGSQDFIFERENINHHLLDIRILRKNIFIFKGNLMCRVRANSHDLEIETKRWKGLQKEH